LLMKHFFAFLLLTSCVTCSAQLRVYTTADAHSHNDYEKPSPFWEAYKNKFGSIEADIFLDNGELIVAHDREQVKKRFTLDSLYLKPLQQSIQANKGFVYADPARQLQLMIDLKTEGVSTLKALVDRLSNFPALIKCPSLKITISGSRPPEADFTKYPSWIFFDGELQKAYTKEQLERIPMISDNFAKYSSWKGEGDMPQNDRILIQSLIEKVHALGKKIRFWNAPDNLKSWKLFITLGVDYINTDHISELTAFVKKDSI
jgi:alkaline phosphatase